jgi:5-(carboxyamino)imidazole ribonucleotide mutase
MPSGVPVACTAIGEAGARNAAILAVQILALSDRRLEGRLKSYRGALEREVVAKDARLQRERRQGAGASRGKVKS